MSIEKYLANQQQSRTRQFKDVVGKLLLEKETDDLRPFKWEDEIDSRELDSIESIFGEPSRLEQWPSYLEKAIYLRMLDPKRPASIAQKGLDYAMKQCRRIRRGGDWLNFALQASTLHILDPHRDLHIDTHTWERMNEKLRIFVPKTHQFLEIAAAMRILDPARDLHITTKEREAFCECLKFLQDHNLWFDYRKSYFQIRLILPEFPALSDKMIWDQIKDCLESTRNIGFPEEMFDIAEALAHMRVLAAYKVEVMKDGILITDEYPPPLDISLPPRPVRKKI